jgi:hypothetical protein
MQTRGTAAILILLVLSQIGGAWMVYTTALWVHKTNRDTRLLDTSKRVQLELTVAEYREALVEEGEIVIQNRLFDVVSVSENGENVIVLAIPDHAENKMKRTLNGLQNETTGWSQLSKLASSFSLTVFVQETILVLESTLIQPNIRHSYFYSNSRDQLNPSTIERPPII